VKVGGTDAAFTVTVALVPVAPAEATAKAIVPEVDADSPTTTFHPLA